MMAKICGITNREDALAAVEHGASALGFIFFPGSPRNITAEEAGEIISVAGDAVLKVGVFVDEEPERIEAVAAQIGLDVAQLHGDEAPDQYPRGVRVWKAHRMSPGAHVDESSPAEALLLDGPATGQTFDWTAAAGIAKKVILAGGLDAGNVEEAIERGRPWGVDASSRLESAPGKKDHARMAAFLKAALAARP